RSRRSSPFFFSSRRRHTRCLSDWSSDVCSSDLLLLPAIYSVRGTPGKQPRVRFANHGSLTLCTFAPSYHSIAIRTALSLGPSGEIGRASCRERVETSAAGGSGRHDARN